MQAYTLFVLCAVLATASCNNRGPPGGLGDIKKADAEVKKAVNAVSSALASETKSAANTKFEPIEYGVQVVAGRNYFVKIRSGPARPGSPFILARIYQDLDGKYSLAGVKNIKDSDQVDYFEGNLDQGTLGGITIKGGAGAVKQASAEVKKAVNAVSKDLAVQAKSAANTKFEALEYVTQVVAGTNYFVKLRVGPARPGSPFVLARIFQSLDGKTYRLDGFKNIKDSDQAEYFDGNLDQGTLGGIGGGVGDVKQADAEVKKAVNAVSKDLAVQAKSAANTKFEAIEYVKQVVAGTNYFVKLRVGPARPGSPFVLARIFQSLDGKQYRLDGFKNIKDSDPADYFDGNLLTNCRAAFC